VPAFQGAKRFQGDIQGAAFQGRQFQVHNFKAADFKT
jgi:hypothetical protein